MIKYDVYKRNGLFYRLRVDNPLHVQAELFDPYHSKWFESALKVGDILTSPRSYLKARNVVFKASLCSQ